MASPVPQKEDVERWTVEQVAVWLRQMELAECCEFFLRRGIDGHSFTELTEEALLLWGRDVSIRNRKKILKLVKQIDNQHLISTGRQQSRQVEKGNPQSPDNDSEDDGFSSDEFDDIDVEEEQPVVRTEMGHVDWGRSSDSAAEEDAYLEPIPVAASRNLPKPLSRPLISHSVKQNGGFTGIHYNRGSYPIEKRPQMPVPPSSLNSSSRVGPIKLTSNFPEFPNKPPPPTPNLTSDPLRPESPRRPPAKPKSSVSSLKREWPPKKPSLEPPINQNGSSSKPIEGGLQNLRKALQPVHHRPPAVHPKEFPRAEVIDNEYEPVTPQGTFPCNENHSAISSSHTQPSREPPPLPQRNQDGRDGNTNSSRPFGGTSSTLQNRPSLHVPNSSNINQKKTLPTPSIPSTQPPKINSGGPLNSIQKRQLKMTRSQSPPLTQSSPLPAPPPASLKHVSQAPATQPPKERAPPPPPSTLSLPTPRNSLLPTGETISVGDGFTFELTPLYRSLMEKPYFHLISRSKSKSILESSPDGMFLIRPSARSSDPLTLCFRYSGRTYNINIRERHDNLYALGKEKLSEMTFACVEDLVSTYTTEAIKLQNGNRVKLTTSPVKTDHIYVKMP